MLFSKYERVLNKKWKPVPGGIQSPTLILPSRRLVGPRKYVRIIINWFCLWVGPLSKVKYLNVSCACITRVGLHCSLTSSSRYQWRLGLTTKPFQPTHLCHIRTHFQGFIWWDLIPAFIMQDFTLIRLSLPNYRFRKLFILYLNFASFCFQPSNSSEF